MNRYHDKTSENLKDWQKSGQLIKYIGQVTALGDEI
jgi:hypothetical protein